MGKRNKDIPSNLKSIAPLLFETIEKYQISKMHIARILYAEEWDDNDQEVKHRLTVRLRNKIDGNVKLSEDELVQIQNILLEMADTIKNNVMKAITDRRKNKIETILKTFSEEEIEEYIKKKKKE